MINLICEQDFSLLRIFKTFYCIADVPISMVGGVNESKQKLHWRVGFR